MPNPPNGLAAMRRAAELLDAPHSSVRGCKRLAAANRLFWAAEFKLVSNLLPGRAFRMSRSIISGGAQVNSFSDQAAKASPPRPGDAFPESPRPRARKALTALRCAWAAGLMAAFVLVSCSPPIKQPVGPERDYDDAKDLFKRGNFDKALEYTEDLANASPANSYTQRAQVLRIIIYGSRVKAYKGLADAYAKGIDKTKNPRFKAAYERLRNDSVQYAAKAALGLAETSHQMLGGGGMGKEVTLEVPYPDTEGPEEVTQLQPMLEGGWIEPTDQDAAALAARRKGIDDELAQAVGGDRSKARSVLSAGPYKFTGVDFGLYLGQELLAGAGAFDRKHYNDYQKFKLVAGQADAVAQAVADMLKTSPDKEKEKAVKKLQADIKAAVKKNS
jgi:hypothetical protein